MTRQFCKTPCVLYLVVKLTSHQQGGCTELWRQFKITLEGSEQWEIKPGIPDLQGNTMAIFTLIEVSSVCPEVRLAFCSWGFSLFLHSGATQRPLHLYRQQLDTHVQPDALRHRLPFTVSLLLSTQWWGPSLSIYWGHQHQVYSSEVPSSVTRGQGQLYL